MEKPLKWVAVALLLRTLGQAGDGIRLGFRYGFDSGQMQDYVYRNRTSGRFFYGTLVDRVYLNLRGWRTFRDRTQLLKVLLRHEIEQRMRGDRKIVVLDVASGPGRYLQEVVLELGAPRGLLVICRDLDEAGLLQGSEMARALGLANFRFEVGDACHQESVGAIRPRPHIAVASSLYGLLDSEAVQRSMNGIYTALRDGGRFLFTTQVIHPNLDLIANVLPNRFGQPWEIRCRPQEIVEHWALKAGFREVASQAGPLGLSVVTTGRK